LMRFKQKTRTMRVFCFVDVVLSSASVDVTPRGAGLEAVTGVGGLGVTAVAELASAGVEESDGIAVEALDGTRVEELASTPVEEQVWAEARVGSGEPLVAAEAGFEVVAEDVAAVALACCLDAPEAAVVGGVLVVGWACSPVVLGAPQVDRVCSLVEQVAWWAGQGGLQLELVVLQAGWDVQVEFVGGCWAGRDEPRVGQDEPPVDRADFRIGLGG
jgi:hypothetical protein